MQHCMILAQSQQLDERATQLAVEGGGYATDNWRTRKDAEAEGPKPFIAGGVNVLLQVSHKLSVEFMRSMFFLLSLSICSLCPSICSLIHLSPVVCGARNCEDDQPYEFSSTVS